MPEIVRAGLLFADAGLAEIGGGWLIFARIGMMRALNGDGESGRLSARRR